MRQVESTERHSGSQVGEAGGVHSVRGFEGSIKMSTGARRLGNVEIAGELRQADCAGSTQRNI